MVWFPSGEFSTLINTRSLGVVQQSSSQLVRSEWRLRLWQGAYNRVSRTEAMVRGHGISLGGNVGRSANNLSTFMMRCERSSCAFSAPRPRLAAKLTCVGSPVLRGPYPCAARDRGGGGVAVVRAKNRVYNRFCAVTLASVPKS